MKYILYLFKLLNILIVIFFNCIIFLLINKKLIILDSADIIAKKNLSDIANIFLFSRNKYYSNIDVSPFNVDMFIKDNLYRYSSRLAFANMSGHIKEMF